MSEHCPTCGQTVREYHHRLDPGLVDALIKFKNAVLHYQRNDINPSEDMGKDSPFELTFAQRANITRIRFHGLLAKVKKPDGTRKTGHWLLTKRGNEFLTKGLKIPDRVYTKFNRVVGHSVNKVSIKDITGTEPYFTDIHTIEYRDVPVEEYASDDHDHPKPDPAIGTKAYAVSDETGIVAVRERPQFGMEYCEEHGINYSIGARCPKEL